MTSKLGCTPGISEGLDAASLFEVVVACPLLMLGEAIHQIPVILIFFWRSVCPIVLPVSITSRSRSNRTKICVLGPSTIVIEVLLLESLHIHGYLASNGCGN
jgi:hypothetical protein